MLAPSGIGSLVPGMRLNLTEPEIKKLKDHILHQFEEGFEEHQAREARLDEWERLYRAEPRQRMRNFPWPKSANLEVPLVAFTTDAIVARIINTVFSMEPFWTIRPLRKEVDPFAKPVEHYLDWSRKAEYDLYKEFKSGVIQTVKYGWGWLKYGWESYTRRTYSVDDNQQVIHGDEQVRRPAVYHVHCRDIILQAGVEDERQAEWITHRIRLTDSQMLMRKYDAIYDNVDEVIKKKDPDSERNAYPYLDERRDSPYTREEVLNTLYEIYILWPVDDGPPIDLIITWHHGTQTILRIIYNPYPWRPFTKMQFIEREGKLEGFGIAERLLQLQEEISTIHRQQVDNATVANTRFFLGKRGAVRPGTEIWPGRFLTVSDPERDIKAIQLGDIYPSMRALEIQALSYAERTSGISDPQLGRESQSLGSRATATGTLAMIQEGNRRFDLNVRDIRESGGEIGRRVLELNQRFRPRGASYFVEGADGQFVEQILNLPPEFSASKLAVELTASTATINRETEKQGLIGLLGVVTQYYERLIQLGMLISNPQAPSELKALGVRCAQGAKHIVDRIVQDFDIRDVNTVVPALLQNEQMSEAFNAPAVGGAVPSGGPGAPSGNGAQPGMGELLSMAGGGASGGSGGAFPQ